MVQQAHPVGGQAQGGGGVHVAGGQAAQAPVAQGGLGLQLLQGGQGAAGLGQGLLHRGVEPQVDEVVGEELAHQKLGGDVVELLIPLDAGGLLQPLGHKLQQGVVQFLVRGGGQVPCPPLPQLLFQFFPNIHCHPSFLARPVMTVSRAIFFASFLVAMPFCMRQLQLWLPTVEGMFMRASLPRSR